MDKSLQQQLYGGGPPRSPFSSSGVSRQSSASASSISISRKATPSASALYKKGATSGAGSGHSSRFSVSGRSNQSMLGIRSDFNVVESYGFQLPVLVNEALTFNEKNQSISVKSSENGWAWVIHGRRLLIWQYKDTRGVGGGGNSPPRIGKDTPRTPRRGAVAQCRELTLPHCDIGHKAALVCVFLSDGQQMASCIAVSPTGDARYWPSIAHDGSSVDVTGILDGQEFDYLLQVPQPQQQGYMLVTTTCSLVYLQHQLVNGRHVLQHKTIRQPAGFLGGIGKKFASIIIGMNSGGERENKFVAIACESSTTREAVITLLADHWLQRWRITNNGSSEQLLFEDGEIVRKIRDEFQAKFWNMRADTVDVELHLLDMHIAEGKTYILAGALNSAHAPQMYYAIVVLTPGADAMRLLQFIPLKLTLFYSTTAGTEKDCLKLRFIICRTPYIYLYTDKVVYPLNLSNPSMGELEAEKVEFHL